MLNKEKLKVMFDLDDVLGDWVGHHGVYKNLFPNEEFPQSMKGFYRTIPIIHDAVKAFLDLRANENIECYILTAPSNKNPRSYTEKRLWVEEVFGMETVENLILASDKSLVLGDVLIDDKIDSHGQERFMGVFMHIEDSFDTNWDEITSLVEVLAEQKAEFGEI